MKAPRTASTEAGYTMAELLIASSLLGVFATVIAMASAFSGREMGQLRERARSAIEMRAIVEHLRRDLGAAEQVDAPDTARLRIRRDAVVSHLAGHAAKDEDPGIEYLLRDGSLVRIDRVTDTEIVVSANLRRFLLDDEGGTGDVYITIETGTDAAGHRVALHWMADE